MPHNTKPSTAFSTTRPSKNILKFNADKVEIVMSSSTGYQKSRLHYDEG